MDEIKWMELKSRKPTELMLFNITYDSNDISISFNKGLKRIGRNKIIRGYFIRICNAFCIVYLLLNLFGSDILINCVEIYSDIKINNLKGSNYKAKTNLIEDKEKFYKELNHVEYTAFTNKDFNSDLQQPQFQNNFYFDRVSLNRTEVFTIPTTYIFTNSNSSKD